MRNPQRVVNYGTFKNDHLVRSFDGTPLGRAIMFDESSYFEGAEVLNVSVLRIYNGGRGVQGLQFYVDGQLYEVAKGLKDVQISKRASSWVITNVCLRKVTPSDK